MTIKHLWIINCELLLEVLALLGNDSIKPTCFIEFILYAQYRCGHINHHIDIHDAMGEHYVDALSLAHDYLDEYIDYLPEAERLRTDRDLARSTLRWVYKLVPNIDIPPDAQRIAHRWRDDILIVEILS